MPFFKCMLHFYLLAALRLCAKLKFHFNFANRLSTPTGQERLLDLLTKNTGMVE